MRELRRNVCMLMFLETREHRRLLGLAFEIGARNK